MNCSDENAQDPATDSQTSTIRSAIIEHIDPEEWDNSLKTETVEKEIMREFHQQWKDHFNRGRYGP